MKSLLVLLFVTSSFINYLSPSEFKPVSVTIYFGKVRNCDPYGFICKIEINLRTVDVDQSNSRQAELSMAGGKLNMKIRGTVNDAGVIMKDNKLDVAQDYALSPELCTALKLKSYTIKSGQYLATTVKSSKSNSSERSTNVQNVYTNIVF